MGLAKEKTLEEAIRDTSVRFGTSGVRGPVDELSDDICFAFTHAFLKTIAPITSSSVAMAIDFRPSSEKIAQACAAAVMQSGLRVDYCGAIPTPALALYAQTRKMPAIMVTGSHIPFDRNGIKYYSDHGEITKADEARILKSLLTDNKYLVVKSLGSVNKTAEQAYLKRYLDFFPAGLFSGKKIAIYQHSGVARDLLKIILESLGAEVVCIGRCEEFVSIDTEALNDEDIDKAREWVKEYKVDAIVSTDGDADRPLITDETGAWLRGDILGILCAQYLRAENVSVAVSSNTAVELSGYFKDVNRTSIGSPYVIAGMDKQIKDGKKKVVGFEPNGGFLVGSPFEKGGRVLPALPTRDAVLPILAVLALAVEKKTSLSELLKTLPKRYSVSNRISPFFSSHHEWLQAALDNHQSPLSKTLQKMCGGIVETDQSAGIRLTFDNGEIIHFRPSKNAPELRCYAESDTHERADTLVKDLLEHVDRLMK